MEITIPLIDMGPYLGGTPGDRAKVAQKIYRSAHEFGFTYLKNFGMSGNTLEASFTVAKSFFNSDEKLKVPFDPNVNNGYTEK